MIILLIRTVKWYKAFLFPPPVRKPDVSSDLLPPQQQILLKAVLTIPSAKESFSLNDWATSGAGKPMAWKEDCKRSWNDWSDSFLP